ncbi:NB-ARC domain-containing disease resistance protein [Actinidia rufa]|uniref:NB-ARC domain-containing disease resistance protein n=1 Tax=Actinidia rufa TaxID=165716 RepID=A0A7J0GD12_9ERIC|nr:NB-ARC domain-containing disease resistance protein [Actinidia rufa]
MAEAAVEFLVGRIGSLLAEKAILLGSVRGEIRELMRELESIRSFLRVADKCKDRNEEVRDWVAQVRDIAYKAEDIIDEFTYEMDGLRRGGARFKGFLRRVVHLPRELLVKHQTAIKLQEITVEIKAIPERIKRYDLGRLEEDQSSQANPKWVRNLGESSFFIKDDDVVGIDNERGLLLKWLMDEKVQRTVISVWGMGGSGKSTLVAKAYKNEAVKRYFDCRAWVTVTTHYRIEDIFRRMIEEFIPRRKELVPSELKAKGYKQLAEILVEFLQQKRYVIVLDDVWDNNFWNQVSAALPDCIHGSRIILTTRNKDIASFPYGVSCHVIEHCPLQFSDAWTLFCKKAFANDLNNQCPPHLENLSRLLVEKCEGLPLALAALGGLMASKERSELKWRAVYDSFNWHLSETPGLEGMKDAGRARRFSIHNVDDEALQLGIDMSQVRSFSACHFDKSHNFPLDSLLSCFRFLRVLGLQDAPIDSVPISIGKLFNLRYLNLRGTGIKVLPKSLERLVNLKSLDIQETEVKALPRGIVKLRNLRHILASVKALDTRNEEFTFIKGVQVPTDIWKLSNLQILQCIEANKEIIRGIGNMTQLQKLELTNVRQEDESALCASLEKLKLLRHLLVMVTDQEETLRIGALSSLPLKLSKLTLIGRLDSVPRWFISLHSIVHLHLHWSRLREDPIPYLQALPNLQRLVLVNAYNQKKKQLCFSVGFPKLHTLSLLVFSELEEVIIEKGGMPSLARLSLSARPKLKKVPRGIEYLTKLEQLDMKDVSTELIQGIRGEESFDRSRVCHIPVINHYYQTPSGHKFESLSWMLSPAIDLDEVMLIHFKSHNMLL